MQGIGKNVARLAVLACAVTLSSCSSTKPLSAAGIEYRLPRTDFTVTLALKLLQCTPNVMFEAELTVAAKAGAQSGSLYLSGEKLRSARIKRELKVSVSDDRVLLAVNSSNADQTPAIVGNYVKALSLIAAALDVDAPKFTPTCHPEVNAAVDRITILKAQLLELRRRLSQSTAATPTAQDLKHARELNTLAREYAALQEGLLRLELTTEKAVALDSKEQAQMARPVPLKSAALSKWFSKFDPDAWARYLGLQWSAKVVDMDRHDALVERSPRRTRSRECGLAIRVPQTQLVQVELRSTTNNFKNLEVKTRLPVAQWNEPAELCLDVGFGEARSVSLAFDKFGQTKEFAWASEARAATTSAALAGMTPDALALRGIIRGPSTLAEQKTEIDTLETQQKLNKLRACRAILEAGGFNCDEAKE